MALRSHPRTPSATSGPGRGPSSDSRARHRRRAALHGHRHRLVQGQGNRPADELRRRAESLFAGRPTPLREAGAGPPVQGAVRAGPGGGSGAEDGRSDERTGTPDRGAEARQGPVGDAEGAPGLHGDARQGRFGIALRERMPLWLQARCGLERRSVAALAMVLVVAGGLAVQHFWSGRTQSVRAPEIVRAAGSYEEQGAGASTGPDSPPVGTGATAVPSAEIVVDVSGKVREPGIHRLPAGSRVADALRAAGGVRPGANVDGLNRARFLMDGEQVIVGEPTGPGGGGSPGGAAPGPPGPAGPGAPAGPTVPVSLSTATVEQLDVLPGVGPVLAQHIVDYRTQHGGFRSVDELREVDGIGERRFADLRNLVRP
ncbi:helix-hairpin-helix domain-containing protein [Streptomyces sp. NPDC093094]|uniref:helix-hairpin-helix domain-containing protein n=1 Tax=Streptomyces sp. NPDC093094 TaxID=3366026 RepID=UPI0038006597